MTRTMLTRSILPLIFLALAACSHESSHSPETPPTNVALPAALKLDVAPPAALSVIDVRKTAADGADVVVTGRVRDFVATRAVFTIADMSLKSCAEPGDTMECETPWDYCCEDATKLAAGTAAIEVHDGGALVTGTAQGWNGLDHLKSVVVKGKAKVDAKGNLAVIASGIFVQP